MNAFTMWDGKSFMYRMNNVAPRTDPCGTPRSLQMLFDVCPLTLVFESDILQTMRLLLVRIQSISALRSIFACLWFQKLSSDRGTLPEWCLHMQVSPSISLTPNLRLLHTSVVLYMPTRTSVGCRVSKWNPLIGLWLSSRWAFPVLATCWLAAIPQLSWVWRPQIPV